MKQLFKNLVVGYLGRQVIRLGAQADFTIIAVTGSIGKSSTKRAIAEVLQAGKRVQWQDGNYNDLVSVPLVFFGLELPSKLFSILGWLKIFLNIRKQFNQPYPYDIVVLELGTDGPGQIASFSKYLQVDIAVVTAVAPEHMENFDDLQAVACEELSVKTFSKQLIIDVDMVAPEYLDKTTSFLSYSITLSSPTLSSSTPPSLAASSLTQPSSTLPSSTIPASADLRFETKKVGTFDISITTKNNNYKATVPLLGEHQLHAVAAAGLVGELCGLDKKQIESGLANITPMPGRMQVLEGKQGSLIIDDTYNASPEAMLAALKTLYSLKAPKRVALLGNMNELGAVSPDLHRQVGNFCDPNCLDLVVTLGSDANEYLAAAAEERGCMVVRTTSPYQAGQIIEKSLVRDSVVLAKGSQNGVFAEEAIKLLLANAEDSVKLVRQSSRWLKLKAQQFDNNK